MKIKQRTTKKLKANPVIIKPLVSKDLWELIDDTENPLPPLPSNGVNTWVTVNKWS